MTELFYPPGLIVDWPDYVLGIDGGASHTVALLARRESGTIHGRGTSGPSNIQAVGEQAALQALDDAIAEAFSTAVIPRGSVAAACLGLAGVDRQEGLEIIHVWADRIRLAATVSVANDATLLFAAGTPDGWGLAVIAGTGSIAFARCPDGRVGRCGGWGYLLGDAGSGYQIALAGLRAVCRAYDHCGPPTALTKAFLQRMNLDEPPDIIPAVYRGSWDRLKIASLSPLVLQIAETGDAVAQSIARKNAEELALTAAESVRRHGLPPDRLPLALTGGVILGSPWFRHCFLELLQIHGVKPEPITLVTEPALGAITIARTLPDSVTPPG